MIEQASEPKAPAPTHTLQHSQGESESDCNIIILNKKVENLHLCAPTGQKPFSETS